MVFFTNMSMFFYPEFLMFFLHQITILEAFANYCNHMKNTTLLRYQFFTCKQAEGRSFNQFVTELKKKSAEYEIATLKDSLSKDDYLWNI